MTAKNEWVGMQVAKIAKVPAKAMILVMMRKLLGEQDSYVMDFHTLMEDIPLKMCGESISLCWFSSLIFYCTYLSYMYLM